MFRRGRTPVRPAQFVIYNTRGARPLHKAMFREYEVKPHGF